MLCEVINSQQKFIQNTYASTNGKSYVKTETTILSCIENGALIANHGQCTDKPT